MVSRGNPATQTSCDSPRIFGEEQITESSHIEKVCLGVSDGFRARTTITIHDQSDSRIYLLQEYTETFAAAHFSANRGARGMGRARAFNYQTQAWARAKYKLPGSWRLCDSVPKKTAHTVDENLDQ